MDDKVKVLTTIPSTDGNFISALKGATMEELDEAIVFIEKNPIGQIARKCAILSEKKRRMRAAETNDEQAQMDLFHIEPKEEPKQKTTEIETDFMSVSVDEVPFKDNVVPFEKKEDEFIPMGTASLKEIIEGIPAPTEQEIAEAKKEYAAAIEKAENEEDENGVKTAEKLEDENVDTSYIDFALSLGMIESSEYTQVINKLNKEMEKYADDENLYVLNGLLKAAREDSSLARGILREGKSYEKAFNYFAKKSQDVGVKLENCYWLTKKKALPLAIEYYKLDEEDIAKKKAEEEAERKKRAEEAAAKKKTRKRTSKADSKKTLKTTDVASYVAVSVSSVEPPKASTEVKEESTEQDKVEETPAAVASEEIPDMSAPVTVPETEKKDDFLTKFANFSFDGAGQLSFI